MSQTPQQRRAGLGKKFEIAQRRKVVEANILAGASYREIAASLDVSPATIASDWKAIQAAWTEHYADDANRWLNTQLRRLEVLLNTIWQDSRGGTEAEKISRRDRNEAIDRSLAIIDRMNRLMNLEQLAGQIADKPLYIQTVEVRGLAPEEDKDDG